MLLSLQQMLQQDDKAQTVDTTESSGATALIA